jgi:outer membrane protein OmpA-like peptidoglycan-associated protein
MVAIALAGGLSASNALASGYTIQCVFAAGSDALNARCEQEVSRVLRVWTRFRDGAERSYQTGAVIPPITLRVFVRGHADGAESRRGGRIVSERRARAVAERIIEAGIPRNLVSVESYGARCLLVPTEPGEAEAQNRRVEIVLAEPFGETLRPCGLELPDQATGGTNR